MMNSINIIFFNKYEVFLGEIRQILLTSKELLERL